MEPNKIFKSVKQILSASNFVRFFAISAILFGTALAFAPATHAGLAEMSSGLKTAAGDLGKTEQTAPQIVGNLINSVLTLVGVLLLVYLIWAGFLWMTAGGDEGKVKQATTMIRNAIIGIFIIGLSFVISNEILNALLAGLGGGGTSSIP
ncbi:MAG: hypothetical protein P1P90_05035 [Patescibacteria group bacterium]|nr:hypothetical protein [Patescibacteria group bacterium]